MTVQREADNPAPPDQSYPQSALHPPGGHGRPISTTPAAGSPWVYSESAPESVSPALLFFSKDREGAAFGGVAPADSDSSRGNRCGRSRMANTCNVIGGLSTAGCRQLSKAVAQCAAANINGTG